MDTDIALACLASGRAMLIGAECRRGVHACPRSSVGERTKRSMSGRPFALQVHLPTVACGATRLYRSDINPEISTQRFTCVQSVFCLCTVYLLVERRFLRHSRLHSAYM